MIVEFIGTHGAGKTTLIRSVQRHLSELGIPSRVRATYKGQDPEVRFYRLKLRKAFDRSLGVLTQPRLAFWCFTQSPKLNVSKGRLRNHMLWWLLGASYFARKYRLETGVQLHDEGPLKVAAALAGGTPSSVEELVRYVPLPDLVVALTIDPKLSIKRVHQRGDDRIPPETIESWAVEMNKGIPVVINWAPTFLADTSCGEDYTKEVVELIAQQYRTAAGKDRSASHVRPSS